MTDTRLTPEGRLAASTEMSPKQVVEKTELLDFIPPKTRVYVTDLGNASEDMIVSAAKTLTDRSFTPVPHMAARRYPSLDAFQQRITRLTQEAGVTDVLAIAGEADKAGPLTSSVALLETGLFDKLGIKTIAVAGHPEGAPDIKPDVIKSFLMRKHELALESDARFLLVTQFGFDPAGVNIWLDEIAGWGNKFPVHIGVAGPAKMTTLLKFAAFAGVENSLKFIKKRGGSVVSMLSGYDPDTMVEPLETRLAARPHSQLAQIHVYPFGGVQKTAEWLTQRGSWSFRSDTSSSLDVQEIAQ
ncbi:methylenetetrahydrofolate reductase (NADPH) [Roseibium hamelinense]|uniref:Methylenetetrahydrofolate reductase (NADPH) n=1 Tax=Roseibium hamelinense TaxID=150831 RepID=A0A562T7L8_9HYPH|nr:methylenetetrahydrofolate reductase [Roseibium hamelinense]MTI43010.1 methylenetetrahydrofolate reductase [Roseibium hamelinense]TWI89621.1 methylenetetrahydrofolate reductase (NADPH) [Roseibium hamelinense]